MTEYENSLKKTVWFAYIMIVLMLFLMAWRGSDLLLVNETFNGLPQTPFQWGDLVYFGLGAFIIGFMLIHIQRTNKMLKQVTWRDK